MVSVVRPARPDGAPDTGRDRRGEFVMLAVLFTAFAVLAAFFVPTHDDWAWGSELGIERLERRFADYNGRWAGNLAVIALTRAGWLRPFLVAAALTALVHLLVAFAGRRTALRYAVVVVLLLAMPVALWRQGVVWISGFTNYALATLGLLVFLRVGQRLLERPPRPAGVVRIAAGAVAGFVAALFMEHVTTYLVVAAWAVVVMYARRRRTVTGEGLAWALGITAGAGLMFSNGAYRRALSGEAQYQQAADVTSSSALADLAGRIPTWLVVPNTWVLAALVVVATLLARAGGTGTPRPARAVPALGAALLVVSGALRTAAEGIDLPRSALALGGLAACLLVALVLVTAVGAVRDPARRVRLFVLTGSALVVAVPLAVVEPVGPRCFVPTYLLLVGLVAVLLDELDPEGRDPAWARGATLAVGALAAALFAGHLVVHATTHAAADRRQASIQAQLRQGRTVIEIDPLPFRGSLHRPDPVEPLWERRFRRYYDLPDDVRIVVGRYTPERTALPHGD